MRPGDKVFINYKDNKYVEAKYLKTRGLFSKRHQVEISLDFFQYRDYAQITKWYKKIYEVLPEGGVIVQAEASFDSVCASHPSGFL